jgi:uncharacterized protein YecE (DUF72 family)
MSASPGSPNSKRAAAHKTRGDVRIGISGWTYAPWRGVFFPKGLPQKKELAYAAETFRSIEVNGTFYGLQRPDAFARWAEQVPEDFVFSVKAPRFITHIRRLRDVEAPVANFLASGVLRLGQKLGPILWQFPPSFRFDAERMKSFLSLLPKDTEAAAEMAKHHDARLDGRDWTKTDSARPLRHAVEIRHDSFAVPEFVDMLTEAGVALVCADTVEWPRLMDVTADFIYCRLHGSEQLYASGYDADAIAAWAGRVAAWRDGFVPADATLIGRKPTKRGRDVFVYFDNDMKVRAPHDATALMVALDA